MTAVAKLPTVDELAQEIRRVDGNHSLGAGALAEALMPFLAALSPAELGGVEAVPKLTRWDCDNDAVFEECDNGEWVKYDDVKSLLSTPPAHGDGEGDEFAQVAASKPCPACGSFGPCDDAQKCMNTAITTNFRGETFTEARQQLVNVLKAQKSWMTGYAESYVDEFADMAATRPTPEAQEARETYEELIYAVASKWPGESRHETALRYIRERENAPTSEVGKNAALALPAQGEGNNG